MDKAINTISNRFNQLLRSLRKFSGKSALEIAKQLNIHPSTQANYETNRDPSLDYLMAFAAVLDISFQQLMSERIKLSNNPPSVIEKALSDLGIVDDDADENPSLEPCNTDPTLCPGGLPKAEVLASLLQQLSNAFAQNNNLALYQQNGQSMIPKIYDKDWLVIDTSDTTIQDGMIYLVEISGQYVARRIQTISDSHWMVVCDNPQFVSFTLIPQSEEPLKIIGRMIYFISQ